MKRKIVFPPVDSATDDGLVAVGGDLESDTILEAYNQGIFPWPVSTYPMNIDLPHTWFSPDPRGILKLSDVRVSRSFEKFLKKSSYRVTFNKSFLMVISLCAKIPRKDQPGTWITPNIISAYTKLFNEDYAYSVEVWDDQRLIAGLYGVIIGDFISGESMFTLEDNASKQGFYMLLKHLEEKGIKWIDTQMVTEVVKQFGGKYISRKEFMEMLKKIDWMKKKSDIF